MTDMLSIIARIVVMTMLLGAVPIFLLHVVRSLADQRRQLKELQTRIDLIEARVGRSPAGSTASSS